MKSEFLESDLELYVQRILTHELYLSGQHHEMIKISPAREAKEGYDAEIKYISPLFLQFKTSDWLTSRSAITKPREALLQKHGINLPSYECYSFSLRKPSAALKNTASAWQHNVLHNLWLKNKGCVAYVAPLFHKRTELHAIEISPMSICALIARQDSLIKPKMTRIIGPGLPVDHLEVYLEGLISIPPHCAVTEIEHSYCFTHESDVTFHSEPYYLGQAPAMFKDFVANFITKNIVQDSQKNIFSADKEPNADDFFGELRNIKFNDDDSNNLDIYTSVMTYGLVRNRLMQYQSEEKSLNVDSIFKELSWLQKLRVICTSLEGFFGITTFGLAKLGKN